MASSLQPLLQYVTNYNNSANHFCFAVVAGSSSNRVQQYLENRGTRYPSFFLPGQLFCPFGILVVALVAFPFLHFPSSKLPGERFREVLEEEDEVSSHQASPPETRRRCPWYYKCQQVVFFAVLVVLCTHSRRKVERIAPAEGKKPVFLLHSIVYLAGQRMGLLPPTHQDEQTRQMLTIHSLRNALLHTFPPWRLTKTPGGSLPCRKRTKCASCAGQSLHKKALKAQ